MSHALRVHETGDANVMQWEEVNVADPAAGEVSLRHTAIGLNFIDIYLLIINPINYFITIYNLFTIIYTFTYSPFCLDLSFA